MGLNWRRIWSLFSTLNNNSSNIIVARAAYIIPKMSCFVLLLSIKFCSQKGV